MFKTFSLCALLAVASANTQAKETATPTMVPMTAAEITTACTDDMDALCAALEGTN